MGTGISTAVAERTAWYLGQLAHTVTMDVPSFWAPLKLVTTGDPYTISAAEQEKAAKNPRWVPVISSSTSSSTCAHITTGTVSEAAFTLLRFCLWPAAREIWTEGVLGGSGTPEVVRFSELRWTEQGLSGMGMVPIPLEKLAAKAHEMGFITGVMVHTFNRWGWTTANFDIEGETWNAAVDAMAIQKGTDDWDLLDRQTVAFPPAGFERIGGDYSPRVREAGGDANQAGSGTTAATTASEQGAGSQNPLGEAVFYPPPGLERVGVNYSSTAGAVAAISVNKSSGEVEVLGVHQVLECGRQVVPELVSGQSEGGIVMGIGHALREYLPLYENGPGNGTWNINRYRVPHVPDVPVWQINTDVLPPLTDTDPPKGMAELGMMPVVPAILNALREATGHRFTDLPVTAEDIQKVQP
ncbi:xanthine dehydrogenase family protein molybdopterin-binding subunit [Roseibium sp. RKSG952]|nr:xanthine dehydrogenase family protein molybdopterin-binding subunit [Roseibium sp. RKSG952]